MHPDPASIVDGLVHAESQVHDGAVDLTVDHVFAVDEPGHLDFGGSELQMPGTTLLTARRRHPDDEYGWWSLEPGMYLIEYNEELAQPPAFLQPREALIAAGGVHASGWVTELHRVGLIAAAGLEIKENARISTLWPRPPG